MANDQTAVKIIAPFSRASLGATRSGNSIRASGHSYDAKRLFRRIRESHPDGGVSGGGIYCANCATSAMSPSTGGCRFSAVNSS